MPDCRLGALSFLLPELAPIAVAAQHRDIFIDPVTGHRGIDNYDLYHIHIGVLTLNFSDKILWRPLRISAL